MIPGVAAKEGTHAFPARSYAGLQLNAEHVHPWLPHKRLHLRPNEGCDRMRSTRTLWLPKRHRFDDTGVTVERRLLLQPSEECKALYPL